ncbi:MAG: ATP-dependent Clp protease adaptor ClpS [Caldilinea sp.]
MINVELRAQTVETPVLPVETAGPAYEAGYEPRWRVLIHNDDVTPFDYVMRILLQLFLLSEEIAEHVAQTAHDEGQAVVVVRPRDEAARLVKLARARARLDGYPLTFSMEPDTQ